MTKIYDFSGYATKNDLKCGDGRIIRKDAFKDNDGMTVPLVWQHLHNEPDNVLGHALLENRSDGVYAYCKFNETTAGKQGKMLVEHGDITAMSIYANGLIEKAKSVYHGLIREVSLVMAGSNPGAVIDNLNIAHSDGSESPSEEEAIIYTGTTISVQKVEDKADVVEHADGGEETVGDVFNSLSPKQKDVVYALIAEALDAAAGEGNAVAQSDIDEDENEGEEKVMKKNVFDGTENVDARPTLTHDQFAEIMADAEKCGSFKKSFLAHAEDYGFDHPEYLFPDARAAVAAPRFIQRDVAWVSSFMKGTYHTPFSRVKSLAADITADEARAKGYATGALKKDEIVKLLRRVTLPTTVYKKQKLDRDDALDITDMDVIVWLKAEMRMMLDEEIARAALVGDGRTTEDEDAINPECIRSIYKDADMYVHRVRALVGDDAEDIIEAMIRGREFYNGSGNPTLYTTTGFLTSMLLLRGTDGHRLYRDQAELESILRVSKIVEVPVMNAVSRITDENPAVTLNLIAIIVNPTDYTFGADKGGEVNSFEDFDIDYNQHKFLTETRCSGALTIPKAAIVIEQVAAPN